jgi:DNA-directed RNA polymerase specialized sigma24 family protein
MSQRKKSKRSLQQEEERIIKGDLQALGRWWEAQGQEIAAGVAVGVLRRDPHQREDAVQETYIKLYKKVQGQKLRENPGAYTRQIANSTAIDLLRKREDPPPHYTEEKVKSHPPAEQASQAQLSNADKVLEEIFCQEIQRDPDVMAPLLQRTHETGFFLWYLQRVQRLTLDSISECLSLSIQTLSDRIRAFKKRRLLDVMAHWSYERIVRSLSQYGTECDLTHTQDEELPERISEFLQSEQGRPLFLYLKGTKPSEDEPPLPKWNRPQKFSQTTGNLLWLLRYTEQCLPWEKLSEEFGLAAELLQGLAQKAYPSILREYLFYLDYLGQRPPPEAVACENKPS